MPKVDVVWAKGLSSADTERVVALGGYRQQAILIQTEFEYWLKSMHAKKRQKETIWRTFVSPWMRMCLGIIYVVYEGLQDMDIQDEPLARIVRKGDIGNLRRFRNAAFHVQRQYRPQRMNALMTTDGLPWALELGKRQDYLVRKMIRLAMRHSEFGDMII